MTALKPIIYFMCLATSALCAALLVRSYLGNRTRLLLYSAICFIGLGLSNALLFVDLAVLPEIKLALLRQLTTLTGMAALIYGFIWESE
jgi:hypothetical protein